MTPFVPGKFKLLLGLPLHVCLGPCIRHTNTRRTSASFHRLLVRMVAAYHREQGIQHLASSHWIPPNGQETIPSSTSSHLLAPRTDDISDDGDRLQRLIALVRCPSLQRFKTPTHSDSSCLSSLSLTRTSMKMSQQQYLHIFDPLYTSSSFPFSAPLYTSSSFPLSAQCPESVGVPLITHQQGYEPRRDEYGPCIRMTHVVSGKQTSSEVEHLQWDGSLQAESVGFSSKIAGSRCNTSSVEHTIEPSTSGKSRQTARRPSETSRTCPCRTGPSSWKRSSPPVGRSLS